MFNQNGYKSKSNNMNICADVEQLEVLCMIGVDVK